MAEEEKNQQQSVRRTRTGVVTSLSGQKTIQVTVGNLVRHPVYGKFMRRRTRLAVQDCVTTTSPRTRRQTQQG